MRHSYTYSREGKLFPRKDDVNSELLNDLYDALMLQLELKGLSDQYQNHQYFQNKSFRNLQLLLAEIIDGKKSSNSEEDTEIINNEKRQFSLRQKLFFGGVTIGAFAAAYLFWSKKLLVAQIRAYFKF